MSQDLVGTHIKLLSITIYVGQEELSMGMMMHMLMADPIYMLSSVMRELQK
jgi:hypothetical protein